MRRMEQKQTNKQNNICTDILVVGAGPVGLFSVFEAGMMGFKCVCVDALPKAGGQLSELYPEKPIYDIPGFKSVLAEDLAQKLKEQADAFEPVYFFDTQVSHCTQVADGFITTCGTMQVHSKVIIIAAGGGMFSPRKPKIDGLEAFEGTSVFYAVKQKDFFRGKTLVIAGGGDSAVDWAVALAELAKQVHVVHRRNEFRASDDMVRRMLNLPNVQVHTSAQITALQGNKSAGTLTAIDLTHDEGATSVLPADVLLCFYGLVPELGPIARWGLNLHGKKIAVEPISQKTNIPGILAVGDIADYDGKLELILTGFAEAAMACKTAAQIIYPDKKFKLSYSTSKGLPGL